MASTRLGPAAFRHSLCLGAHSIVGLTGILEAESQAYGTCFLRSSPRGFSYLASQRSLRKHCLIRMWGAQPHTPPSHEARFFGRSRGVWDSC